MLANEEISDGNVPFHSIGVELLNRRTNRVVQLVNNVDPKTSLDGKRQWYNLEFVQPLYLRGVVIHASGYESWHEVEFEVFHIDGTVHIQSIKFNAGVSELALGKLASGFRFRPSERFSMVSSPKINRIVLIGLSLEEFHSYEWVVKDFEESKRLLAEREKAFEEKREQIASLEKTKAALDSEIGKSRSESEGFALKIAEFQVQSDNLKLQIINETSAVERLIAERNETLDAAMTASSALKRLKDELKMFPSEIAPFVEQGNKTIWWYLSIASPFALIIGIVLFVLFSGAADLTQLYKEQQEIDVWTIFLTRLPFVFLCVAMLEICGYIVGRLVFEIIKINRQRLNLSKISIIAKDVVDAASQSAPGLTDSQIVETEMRLKMEMLREHIKDYVGPEFEYKGTLLTSVVTAIVEKVGSSK